MAKLWLDSDEAKRDLLERPAMYFQNINRNKDATRGVIQWLEDYEHTWRLELIEQHQARLDWPEVETEDDWPEVPS